MPQKKNPDALELLRGKSGRTIGQVTIVHSRQGRGRGVGEGRAVILGLMCMRLRARPVTLSHDRPVTHSHAPSTQARQLREGKAPLDDRDRLAARMVIRVLVYVV